MLKQEIPSCTGHVAEALTHVLMNVRQTPMLWQKNYCLLERTANIQHNNLLRWRETTWLDQGVVCGFRPDYVVMAVGTRYP